MPTQTVTNKISISYVLIVSTKNAITYLVCHSPLLISHLMMIVVALMSAVVLISGIAFVMAVRITGMIHDAIETKLLWGKK